MPSISKIKLPNIEEAYDIQAKTLSGLSATVSELNHLMGATDNIQSQLLDRPTQETVNELLSNKVDKAQTINNIPLTGNIELTASDVGADASGSANAALDSAKEYADSVKNDLLNGAGKAYDTLKELGDLIDENIDAIEALEIVAAGKADKVHTHVMADITDLTIMTVDEIDAICGASIASASEVVF